MNTIENGEEEDRFCLLFKIKLLMKTCLPVCLEWIPGANTSEEYFILPVTFLLIIHCSGCQHLVIIQKSLSIEVFDRLCKLAPEVLEN